MFHFTPFEQICPLKTLSVSSDPFVTSKSEFSVGHGQNAFTVHCKNSGVKLTPAGVNTGPISNGVNLTPFWCYFNTFRC